MRDMHERENPSSLILTTQIEIGTRGERGGHSMMTLPALDVDAAILAGMFFPISFVGVL